MILFIRISMEDSGTETELETVLPDSDSTSTVKPFPSDKDKLKKAVRRLEYYIMISSTNLQGTPAVSYLIIKCYPN